MKVNFNQLLLNDEDKTRNIIINLVQCKICLNILNNPYDCNCCNQTFCKKCIVNYINTNKKCPYSSYFFSSISPLASSPLNDKEENRKKQLSETEQCQQFINGLHPSSSNIVKAISSLKFSCEYKRNGCIAQLSYDEVDDHSKGCKYKKGPLPTRNGNPIDTGTGTSNRGTINHLDSFSNSSKDKDKFKLHDSTMSFRKVELISDSSPPSITLNQQQFNHRMMERIDKIYDMISNMSHSSSIERKRFSNKFSLNNTMMTEEIMVTASPKKKHERKQSAFAISNNNQPPVASITLKSSIDNIRANMDRMINKITSLERMIQTVSSMSNQQYSIANNDDLLSLTISSTPKKNTNCLSIKSKVYNNSLPLNTSLLNTAPKTFNSNKQCLNTNIGNSSIKKKKALLEINNSKLNNSICCSNSKGSHHPITSVRESNFNSNTIQVNDSDMNKIEEMLTAKTNNLKTFIEQKCINDLRNYFLELTLDNSNLFVQKIDEVINILPPIKSKTNYSIENAINLVCILNNNGIE